MSFEWQTEEDYNWDEELEIPEPPQPERRHWPWLILAGVLLVGTAVYLLYRQLDQRVEAATDGVATDLVASYAVLQQAAQNKDENLFNSLLSGRNPEWSQAQQDNISSGLLFDRPGFNLEWQPGVAETAVISQTLSPDLAAAELTTLQNYSLDIGHGLTETVQLERLDVYRLGEDRWLYAPPEREFWGVRRRLEGQLLSVRYPARDEEIVHRLAADLEAKLVQLCTVSGYVCPPEARVRLIFSPEPDSLGQTIVLDALAREPTAGTIWNGEQAIVLPAPTLVGLPQNEVGYRAILGGYARQMLTLAINDATGWECCQNAPFYRAVVTYQLYELGVGSWPLSDAAVTLPDDLSLSDGARFWNAPFPETPTDFVQTPALYIVVDFLVNELHLSAREIATLLITSEEPLFGQWLVELAGPPWTEATLNDTFRRYVAAWQDEPAGIAWPDADLLMLCQDTTRNAQALYQYNFAQEELLPWQDIAGRDIFFTAFPDGSGLAVSGLGSDGQPETYLLYNGETRIEVNWANVESIVSVPPLAVPTIVDPNGRYLLWTFMPGYSVETFFALTDLEACHEGDSCEAIPLGGYPIWSPTSERLITLTVTTPWWREGLSNGLMLLRDAPTAEAINSPGFGSSVFWLAEDQFGYLTQFQNRLQQLVTNDIDLGRPTTILTNNSLLDYFSADERPDLLFFEFAQPLPTDSQVLIIVARGDSNLASEVSTGNLFWYDQTAESVMLHVPLDAWRDSALQGYRFSPDGRFLLFTYAQPEAAAVNLLLQDANGPHFTFYQLLGETQYPRHFYADWSPDGEWLAMPELGYIRLWHGWDEHLLDFENLNCTNAGWIDRMEP